MTQPRQERDLLLDKFKRLIQQVVLIRRTCNFVVVDERDFTPLEARDDTRLVPIAVDNLQRVVEFRPASRVRQYREKLAKGEIGYFVEHNGRMIGSNWATVNPGPSEKVARTVMRLGPMEGLTHDGVIAPEFRGRGFGAYMINRLVAILLHQHDLNRIIIDVNVKNKASLRMMEKAGFRVDHEALYVAVFNRLLFHRVLKRYTQASIECRDCDVGEPGRELLPPFSHSQLSSSGGSPPSPSG